jgi:hypothetical protein
VIRSLAVASLFVSGDAFAFELSETSTGAELRWEPGLVWYGAAFTASDPAGERFAAACRAAADTWELGSNLGLDLRWAGPEHRNRIELVSRWDERFGDAARTVAHTELAYDTTTGLILEGDIFLNGETFSFEEDGFDAQSVVLHEMGHLIGIAHSCGDPGRTHPSCFSVPEAERMRVLEAVMAPTLAPGVSRRALTADDLDALAVHYGARARGDPPPAPAISRVCPEGALSVTPPFPATLRFPSGDVQPLAEWEGAADLIVHDPSTGLFAVLYLAEPPPPCLEPEAGGCGCTVHRQPGGNVAMLWLVLAVMAVRRRWIVPLAAALFVLSGGEALAFKCSRVGTGFGPSLIWNTRTIPWYADAALFEVYGDAAKGQEDVIASFQAWEDVACSDITFPLAAIIPDLRAEYVDEGENRNVVVALKSGWTYDRGALAVTTSAYDVKTGVVVDADIEINAEHFTFARVDPTCMPNAGTMDLRNTITHEAGHVIGLDHPPNTPSYEDVTMYASAPPCEDKKRTLEADDIDGLCSIYPVGNPTQQCYPPEGPSFMVTGSDDGFGCTTSGGAPAPWILAVLLFRRRSRSRARARGSS